MPHGGSLGIINLNRAYISPGFKAVIGKHNVASFVRIMQMQLGRIFVFVLIESHDKTCIEKKLPSMQQINMLLFSVDIGLSS